LKEVTYWEMLERVTQAPSLKIEGDFSPKFKDFMGKCLDKNKETRPSSSDMLVNNYMIMLLESSFSTRLRKNQRY